MTDSLHDLAPLYALDALEPHEAAEFEAHLATCAPCQQELRDSREVAGLLAVAVARTPPPALRDRIIASAAASAAERRAPAGVASVGSDGPAPSPAMAADSAERIDADAAIPVTAAPSAEPAGVTVLRPHRWTDSWSPARSLGVAAAVVLALVIGGASIASRSSDPDPVDTAAAEAVLRDPGAVTYSLTGPNGSTGRVVWSHQRGEAVLLSDSLADAGPGRTYQVWFIDGGAPVPGPVVGADGSTPFAVPASALPATVAITIEPAGGSVRPSAEPVLAGSA